jgi:CTP:molybdopterin cytidylyltransferase MocA
MGSERLPGKILAPLGGRPLLAQLCSRIRPARVDEWWLATTSDPADDVTEAKTPNAPMRFGFAAAWPRATQMLTQLMNRIGVRPELAKRPS